MNPADKYREALMETIYFMHYLGNKANWQYSVLCKELDRVGHYIPKETK